MIKAIENIECLESNIFTLTPLLVSFYRNMPLQKGNLFYAYLVFPLLLHKPMYVIQRMDSRTKLSRITGNRDIMAGFQERFKYYRSITNDCIQYGIECKWLEIDPINCSILTLYNYRIPKYRPLNKAFKMASMLHYAFSKDIINTYMEFGIKEL